jgi:hypothetical protein
MQGEKVEIIFKGESLGAPIGASRVPADFMAMICREISPYSPGDGHPPVIAISEGSLAITVLSMSLTFAEIVATYSANPRDIWSHHEEIAHSLNKFRDAALRLKNGSVTIKSKGTVLILDESRNIDPLYQDMWVPVTKYLRGRVVEMGGTSKTNIHLKVDGVTDALVISASEEQMRAKDWLYGTVMVHIEAQQNLANATLKGCRLISLSGPFEGKSFEERLAPVLSANKGRWQGLPASDILIKNLRNE